MKTIAACLFGFLLLVGPTIAMGEDDEPAEEEAPRYIEYVDRHQHHSHIALYRSHSNAEQSCTRFLSIPFFSLFRSERYGDRRDLRILSLPIIGSLYRHTVDGNRHRREFLFLIDIETES